MVEEEHTAKNRIDGVAYDLVAPETNPSNDEIQEFVRTLFGNDPYYSFVGLTVERIGDNKAVLSVPNEEPALLTPNPPALQSLHGGVMSTLVDYRVRQPFSPLIATSTATQQRISRSTS